MEIYFLKKDIFNISKQYQELKDYTKELKADTAKDKENLLVGL